MSGEIQQRVSLVTLGVADFDRAVVFYEKVVGWKRNPGPPTIAFFDLNGLIFSLYRHADLAADMGLRPAVSDGYQGFTLSHNVASKEAVDAVFARLKAAGAKIVKPPQEVFWGGYSGYFADPDGHKWEVAFNPFWTIKKDGRISLTKS